MYSDDDMREAYKEGYEKGKTDGDYAVLADVRAELKRLSNYVDDGYVSESLEFCIKDLEKINEHFS